MRRTKQTKRRSSRQHHPSTYLTLGSQKVVKGTGRKAPRKKAVKTPIQMGDKLFLITRRDISPGYQAVQSCHALRQFTAEHPDVDLEWFNQSNYLALLSVADEVALMKLITKASDAGLRWSAFREPDVGGKITAIAIEPHPTAAQLCKNLPLALKELT